MPPALSLETMPEGRSIISLDALQVKAHIGATEEEREEAQDIQISFKCYIKGMPKASFTDALDDTICYHEVSDIIKAQCAKSPFRLLEHLCFTLHQSIRQIVPQDMGIWIKTVKVNPPIDGLVGSTSFEYSDYE